MLRMAVAQWRVRARRSLALLSMIAVSVAGFTLLTGAAVTSRLDVSATVRANFRPAYDILVRPGDEVLPLERERNLVQAGQLAGMSGGITVGQWRALQRIPGVAVAAPVVMVGYVMRTVPITVDLSGALDPAAERQVIRVRPSWVTDAGLSSIPDGAALLYVTRNRLEVTQDNGTPITRETVGGRSLRVCPGVPFIGENDMIDPTDIRGRSSLTCVDTAGRPLVTLLWSIPFLVAAVDPESEAALAGLDRAVTGGRYFTPAEKPGSGRLDGVEYPYASLPVLVADRAQTDSTLSLDIQRLEPAAAELVPRPRDDDRALRADLGRRPGTTVDRRTIGVNVPYRELVHRMRHPSGSLGDDMATSNTLWLDRFWTVGPARLVPDGAGLRAETATHNRKVWGVGADGGIASPVPMEFADTGVRGGVLPHHVDTSEHDVQVGERDMPDVALDAVGTFDPGRVQLGGTLSAVPMDTYFRPGAAGVDEASRRALGGRELEPNANVTGLLSQPPLMLTTMEAAATIFGPHGFRVDPPDPAADLNRKAPVSMVRVRIDGEVGMDALSRERVRRVAEQIAETTGLHVDVTLGSSPTAVPVRYPAGGFGRPELVLGEPWVKKGVAAVLVTAADRKSVLLSGLVLAVCALAVWNANQAAVRARRTELGILACLGWTRRHLIMLLVTETAGIGLAAGLAGTALAVPLALLFGLTVSWSHLAAAVPAALLIALAAGAWPAWRAARPDPAATVRPAVATSTVRLRTPRRVAGLALAGLARTPGRTLLGAASLLIGVAGLTMLLAITFGFRGAATGTLLGEAVTLRVRTVDYLAVAVTIVLGVVSVADVLYLGIAERAAQFALFSAVGWTDGMLGRLVTAEALGIGLLGGVLGAGTGLGAATAFAGGVTAALVWCAVAAMTAGVAVAALAVLVPLAVLRRLPTAQLLAQE